MGAQWLSGLHVSGDVPPRNHPAQKRGFAFLRQVLDPDREVLWTGVRA